MGQFQECNLWVTGVPTREEEGRTEKKNLKTKMTEKFPNSMKIIKPQRVAAC
jgi:hypothetical protein